MSDADLGKWFKEKWPELMILGALVGGVGLLFQLNREVGVLSEKVSGEIGVVSAKVSGIDTRLSDFVSLIDTRLSNFHEDLNRLADLPKAVAVLEEKLNGLLASNVTVGFRETKEVQYTVARVIPYAFVINQCGRFSPDTKVEGRENVYRWEILEDITGKSIDHVWVGFEDAFPGTSILGTVTEGGKACEITITAKNPDNLEAILATNPVGCISILVSGPTATTYEDPSRVPEE